MKTAVPVRYFAASNSAHGFCNYFDDIFSTAYVDHLYIIKGGPGTGKSYFMKTVARRAVMAGYAITEYACSSDPDSLDGLILRKNAAPTIGFVDGTAPHVAEVMSPGVHEELIDLGVFWDTSVILDNRDAISRDTAAKAQAYADAYAHLRAAGEMVVIADRLLEPALRHDRMAALIARILRGLPKGCNKTAQNPKITANATVPQPCKTGAQPQRIFTDSDKMLPQMAPVSPNIALRRAIGMTGRVTLPTYEQMADTVVLVGDGKTPADRLLAARIIGRLYDQTRGAGCDVLVSRDPIYAEQVDGLLYPSPTGGTAILPGGTSAPAPKDNDTTTEARVRTISLRRCVDTEVLRSIRPDLRRVDALRERHEEEAIAALSRAHDAHFALESIYTSAMDIPAKEAFCESFCARLFG